MSYALTRERCAEKAAECQKEADRAESDGDRKIYGRLADYWRAMARAAPHQAPYPAAAPADRHRRH